MNQKNKKIDHATHHDQEHKDDQQQPRRNPRLVFNDPYRFFRDLLMEQQEQS